MLHLAKMVEVFRMRCNMVGLGYSELLGCFRHAQHASDVCAVLICDGSPHPLLEMKIYFITTVPTPKKF